MIISRTAKLPRRTVTLNEPAIIKESFWLVGVFVKELLDELMLILDQDMVFIGIFM